MSSFIRVAGQPEVGYREELARHPIIIAFGVLLLAGLTLGLISRNGHHEHHAQTAIVHNLGAGTAGVGRTIEDIQKALQVERLKVIPQPEPGPDSAPPSSSELPSLGELNKLPGTISGIIWRESDPYAIIDGDLHPVGDKVTYTINGKTIGFTVVSISKEKVVFRNPFGEEFEEPLY